LRRINIDRILQLLLSRDGWNCSKLHHNQIGGPRELPTFVVDIDNRTFQIESISEKVAINVTPTTYSFESLEMPAADGALYPAGGRFTVNRETGTFVFVYHYEGGWCKCFSPGLCKPYSPNF
jgi:hypothetical protein